MNTAKYPVYKEDMPLVLSDLLIFEIDARYCREEASLAPTEKDLPLGTVLQESANGLIPLALTPAPEDYPNAPPLEGEPYAVLMQNMKASTAEQTILILRRIAIVHADKLIFDAGITSSIAIAKLNTMGIVCK